ncbi:large ribosomal subunit protein uL23m isoform X3 [Rhinoraja longicauda]
MARRVMMTKPDVKNYLQDIYSVPVAAVRTRIQYCTNKKKNHKNQKVKRPDYKVAYVQLAEGQTFKFPNIFPEKDQTPESGSLEEMQNKLLEDDKQKQKADPRRGGVTEWFGL